RAASVESVACFESALDAVCRLPETDDTLRRGIDIRTALRLPLSRIGRISRLETVLEEAARVATRLGDERRGAVVAIGRSHRLYSTGENERACKVGERAVTLARRSRDRELEEPGPLLHRPAADGSGPVPRNGSPHPPPSRLSRGRDRRG